MTDAQTRAALAVLENALRRAKADYHSGRNDVTYDDLRAAGERLLRLRYAVEAAYQGRATPRKVTARAIADVIR